MNAQYRHFCHQNYMSC